jgi:Serine/threonine protein kinase
MREKFDFIEGSGLINETYNIIKYLRSGGIGEIYLAYHKRLKKQVIIKATYVSDISENLLRVEADILKNLKSPHLPQVLDVFFEGEYYYTIIEYIKGKTLKEIMINGGINWEDILKWAKELLEVVVYLHSQNPPVLHTDIKPENIIITESNNLCLIDFNISVYYKGEKVQSYGYTKKYSPPEQWISINQNTSKQSDFEGLIEFQCEWLNKNLVQFKEVNIDIRSDIYSIGATLHHLLLANIQLIKSKIFQIQYKKMKKIIKIALKKEPDKRYQSAKDMLKDIYDVENSIGLFDIKYFGRQFIKYFLEIIFVMGFIFCSWKGKTIVESKEQLYLETVKNIYVSGNIERSINENKDFNMAITINPNRAEAYLELIKIYYFLGRYKDAVKFAQDSVLNEKKIIYKNKLIKAEFYYYMGSSYMFCNELGYALYYLEEAVRISDWEERYLNEYLVALLRAGDFEEADRIMEFAKEERIDIGDMKIIMAEKKYTMAKYDEVIKTLEDYMNIHGNLSNEVVKSDMVRVAMLMSNSYLKLQNYEMQVKILESAYLNLILNERIVLLIPLANAYANLGQETGDEEYYIKALEYLKEYEKNGIIDYDVQSLKVILYRELKNYKEAIISIEKMEEIYGMDYNIAMQQAFIELEIEADKMSSSRNYIKFREYADNAFSLYEIYIVDGTPDIYMDILKQAYLGIEKGNWFINLK